MKVVHASRGIVGKERVGITLPAGLDTGLICVSVALLGLGLVMVTSASISMADNALGEPLHYLARHGIRVLLGVLLATWALRTPLAVWERGGPILMLTALFLLIVILLPGMGRTVNGATRWLDLGLVTFQVSELAKLFLVVYLSGYLVRRAEEVRTTAIGFFKPMGLLVTASALLLMEPDFGAAAVVLVTGLGMLFLGGVRFWQFSALMTVTLGMLIVVAVSSPYRLQRITSFVNPWADPYDSGFQLTQSLIAIGSGGWFGVGLGASVQKLFYLPEAHTDFLFAIVAEELGLLGSVSLLLLYGYLIWRAMAIGVRSLRAGRYFGGYLAYGIGLLIGLQAFINIGVNMGVLPTKGLTLPLMSYGGNSVVMTCLAIGLLLRIHYESEDQAGVGRGSGSGRKR
jgi:cell division protein FtsW